MLQIPSFFHIKNTPCMIFVLDQGGQHLWGAAELIRFVRFLYLTKVDSINIVTAELIRFV